MSLNKLLNGSATLKSLQELVIVRISRDHSHLPQPAYLVSWGLRKIGPEASCGPYLAGSYEHFCGLNESTLGSTVCT